MSSSFAVLNAVNCKEHVEKKNGLSYLPWAWAWAELKKLYPASYYTIYENEKGLFYHTDGKTCWVKTGVTLVDENEKTLEHIEYLPVMDFRNQSIPLERVTSTDVNKAIQRSLTKAAARHGLGLYIYAGEDLPEGEEAPETKENQPQKPAGTQVSNSPINPPSCADCGCVIAPHGNRTAQQMARAAKDKFGRVLCVNCAKEESTRIEASAS